MGKNVPDSIIDSQLDLIEGTTLHVCSAEPANYAGIAAVELAKTAISGSYTKATGTPSGRQTTCPAQAGLTVDSNGTATHVAISNGSNLLQEVTTCTSQAVTAGGTLDTSSFVHTITNAA